MSERTNMPRGWVPGLLVLIVSLLGCGSTPPVPREPPPPPPDTEPVVEAPPEEPGLPTLARRANEPRAPGGPVLQEVQHGPPRSVVVSDDGRLMAQMGYRGAVSVVDLATGHIRFADHPFVMGGRDRGYVRLDRSGTLLLASGTSRLPRPGFVIYDLHTGRRIEAPAGNRADLAELHPGGTHVAWIEHDEEGTHLKIARLPDLSGVVSVDVEGEDGDEPELLSMEYSPDGSGLLIVGWNLLQVRDGTTGQLKWAADLVTPGDDDDSDPYAEAEIADAFFTDDGEHVVVAESNSVVRWLDPADGTEQHRWFWTPEGDDDYVSLGDATFTPDGRRLVSNRDETRIVADGETGEIISTIAEDDVPEGYYEARLTPDGTQVLMYGYAGLLRVNAADGSQLGPVSLGDGDMDVHQIVMTDTTHALVFGTTAWLRLDMSTDAAPERVDYRAGPFSIWRPVFRADSHGLGLLGRRISAFLTADADSPWGVDPCVSQASFSTWASGAVPPAAAGGGLCRRQGEQAREVEGDVVGRDRERRVVFMRRGRNVFLVDVESGTDRTRIAAPRAMLAGCQGSCRLDLTLALDDSRVLASRFDGTNQRVWAFDTSNGRLLSQLSHQADRYDRPVFSANGSAAFFRGRGGLVGYYLGARRPRALLEPTRSYRRVILHPAREVLAIQVGDELRVYDLAAGRQAFTREIGDAGFRFTPDGARLVLTSEGRSEVVDWSGGSVVRQGNVAAGEQVTEEGGFVTSCVDGRLQIRRLEETQTRTLGPCLYGGPTAVSPDGRLLAVAESPTVRVYAIDGSASVRVRVVTGPDGDAFLVEGSDGTFQTAGDLTDAVLYRPEGRIGTAVLTTPDASGHASPDLLQRLLAGG